MAERSPSFKKRGPVEFFCSSCGIRFKGEHLLYKDNPAMFNYLAHQMQGSSPCKMLLHGEWAWPVRPVLLCPVWGRQMRRAVKRAITFADPGVFR